MLLYTEPDKLSSTAKAVISEAKPAWLTGAGNRYTSLHSETLILAFKAAGLDDLQAVRCEKTENATTECPFFFRADGFYPDNTAMLMDSSQVWDDGSAWGAHPEYVVWVSLEEYPDALAAMPLLAALDTDRRGVMIPTGVTCNPSLGYIRDKWTDFANPFGAIIGGTKAINAGAIYRECVS